MENGYDGIVIPVDELITKEVEQRIEIDKNKAVLSSLMDTIKSKARWRNEDEQFIKIWKTRDNFYCSFERFEKIKHVFEEQGYSVKYIHRFILDDYYLLEWN